MNGRWKEFRTNMMYWRFRHITRNRMRLRSWWQRHRPRARGAVPRPSMYRERGQASVVYRGSTRNSWTALLAMVSLLTALSVYVNHIFVNSGFVYLIESLIVVGSIYWALRGV